MGIALIDTITTSGAGGYPLLNATDVRGAHYSVDNPTALYAIPAALLTVGQRIHVTNPGSGEDTRANGYYEVASIAGSVVTWAFIGSGQGPPGPPGTNGTQGIQGAQGIPGPSGITSLSDPSLGFAAAVDARIVAAALPVVRATRTLTDNTPTVILETAVIPPGSAGDIIASVQVRDESVPPLLFRTEIVGSYSRGASGAAIVNFGPNPQSIGGNLSGIGVSLVAASTGTVQLVVSGNGVVLHVVAKWEPEVW